MTRVYGLPAIGNASAWTIYSGFLDDPHITFLAEPATDALDDRWQAFAARATASPKLWMDAYFAAFATVGGHQLVTTDKAFGQFKGLEVVVLERGG